MQDPRLIDYWRQQFNRLKADGVDFVAAFEISSSEITVKKIYSSYTKEEFMKLDDYNYPRSHYVFWRRLFGVKCYILQKE